MDLSACVWRCKLPLTMIPMFLHLLLKSREITKLKYTSNEIKMFPKSKIRRISLFVLS
jgi:hypothetical protein